MVSEILVTIGLFAIFLVVLVGPFRVRAIEHNLEPFLLAMGIIALTIAGFAVIPGETTGWTLEIVEEALTSPLYITEILGIPIGIVQIVLLVGLIIYRWHGPIHAAIGRMAEILSLRVMVALLILLLGLVSSIVSAIIAAIILVEVLCVLPIERGPRIELTVIACFAIGLGAALTPLGEPLSTIAVSKLSGPPYFADFFFLIDMLGIYILPGIVAFALLGMYRIQSLGEKAVAVCEPYSETLRDVILRAARVYVFIAALVLLGEGFKPIILEYVARIPAELLFWINTVSAILDNATLTAAEIGPYLTLFQIRALLVALVVAGGMLIPGNIPNIIAAGKLRITSKEWARVGVPIGIAALAIYFAVLFIPQYLGF